MNLSAEAPISNVVREWLQELSAARARPAEKRFRKEGSRILHIYDGQEKERIPFNILYSNTETLLPALYNSTPRSVVQRRFKDEDPLGRLAALAGRRALDYCMDTNSEDYATFDSVVEDAVLDALLPGRGVTRVRYDAEMAAGVVTSESVCYESIRWNRVIFGYARKWRNVPWLAFEYDVTRAEAEQLFGKAVVAKLTFVAPSQQDSSDKDDDEEGRSRSGDDTREERKLAKVYEIWDKRDRKVKFVSPGHPSGLLKTDNDPLGLTGFFPVPRPLTFLPKSNDLDVTALYTLYENQAKELNRITIRINRVVEALKVRGAYDGTLGDEIEKILTKDDNALVKADNVAALQEGGLVKAIWLMPLAELQAVLQQLILARQQCKQVIYEITGISDILRGQSVASETATAQEIKNQWGTLRLKKAQRTVQLYVRDLLRMTLEIAATKLSVETWAKMTGLPFTTQEQKAQATAQAQMAVSMGQQPPPQVAQTLQQPTWEDVLAVLRDDTQRQYRIDIETNSTVDLEATEDQKQMSEMFAAIGGFLQGVTPLVQSGSLPFEAAQSMLLTMVRRYRFGVDIEEQIKQMRPPQPPDAKAQQAEQQAQQMELQMKQMDMQARQQELQQEGQLKEREHAMKLEELQAKAEYNKLMARIKMMEAEQKMRLLQAQAMMPAVPAAPAAPPQKAKAR